MIRLAGFCALLLTVALIAYRVGWECALYFGSPQQLADAARLRLAYWLRMWGVE